MISVFHENTFVLDTENTTYAFRVCPTGQLEHLYYGPYIHVDSDTDLSESHTNAHGNSILYENDVTSMSLEDLDQEAAFYGKGDIREALLEIEAADGSSTLDFVFDSYELLDEKVIFETLPTSYDDEGTADHLKIRLKDRNHGYTLDLFYSVFNESNVIARSSIFSNTSGAEVVLKKAMGALIDFPTCGYRITSFHGGWTNEMNRVDTVLCGGKFVNSSFTGTSSNRSNPLTIMSEEDCTEDRGLCYGFNLVYSGNHYTAYEVNSFGKTRFVSGINPTNFEYKLLSGEKFEIPEVVMTVSEEGMNGMSQNFHSFVRKNIVRGVWKDRVRPVLLNSWEANYFNIDEDKLVKLAKKGKDVGIELFVMDDGWFGSRSDDKRALGDWSPNSKKLPHGLKGLADRIHDLGMDFGIWIEPEMVNTDSDLYRAYPEYSMDIPGMAHSEGRNQRLLDLANPAVVELMTEKMSAVLHSAKIDYVKWDMNRIVSDVYSRYLPKDRQGEVLHRYVLGFYKMLKSLTEEFPEILFEGCASGGNRFDLGMLSYFPQIWASDNTDAISRMDIQNGYSYGYPQNVYTCHISAVPNHQTLRITPLSTRAHVAFFGNMGVECNLLDMSQSELNDLKNEIDIYKKYRETFQNGKFYRGRRGNLLEWTVVRQDKQVAVGVIAEKLTHANNPHLTFFPKGLDPDTKYHFFNIPKDVSIKDFGDLINTVGLPIHIKQNSLVYNMIDKFRHIDGEREDTYKYGNALMKAGQRLTQGYIGTGVDNVRVFKGGDSRLYFMEADYEGKNSGEIL
ncbi:MAG: alpha-galactosidase [Lachnospiraceae bacterium]|nr:alpha-galactosidase [Lachnospiraceae bacterium]